MRYLITDKQYEQLITIKLRRLSRVPQMLDYAIDKVKQRDIRDQLHYIELVRQEIRDILNKYYYNYSYKLSSIDTQPRRDDAYIIAHNLVHQNYRYISKSFYKKN